VSEYRHLDKVGIVGSAFAALCCLGTPAVLAVVSAIGLGFLINDVILAPLLIASLVVTLWGLAASWKRHGRPWALLLGAVAGAMLFLFSFLRPSPGLAYTSIALLVAASLLNVMLARSPGPAVPPAR